LAETATEISDIEVLKREVQAVPNVATPHKPDR
jgi:hypothetical protein